LLSNKKHLFPMKKAGDMAEKRDKSFRGRLIELVFITT
jgi:hypothetical protein